MILRTLFWCTFLHALYCHPAPQNLKLPDLNVSTPEEVNSLELEEPLGRSIDPQTTKNSNFDETVKEVEEIIKNNPALPRLTRGEILDLLENITTTDEQKVKLFGRGRDPKSIMVVMPYTPTNDKNMEDLYTKAPVTHIIGAEPFKTKEEAAKVKHSRRRPPVQFNDTDNDLSKKPLPTEEKKKYSASISEKVVKPSSTHPRTQVRRKRPEATTVVTLTTYHPKQTETTTYQPKQTETTTYHPRQTETTTYHPKTRRPMRRRTTTTPQPIQHPNHQYPEKFVPSDGIRIIESPQLSPAQINQNDWSSDLDLQANVRQEVKMKPDVPFSPLVTAKPADLGSTTKSYNTRPLTEDINVPEGLKNVMKDLNLEMALNPKQKNSLEDQNRIKHILASIGALPASTTTTTTTTLMPNAEGVVDSLSPEMRDLLLSFGLLPNSEQKPIPATADTYYPEKAEVNPESYINFKPLPDDGPSRDDMDALLASFGLGRSARREKAVKIVDSDNKQGYNFDMVPEHLKGVISDLGISETTRDERKIRTPQLQKTAEKQHVFNPDTQYATEEELKKLEKLISMIKQLEKMNGTATEDDLKKIDLESLKELVTSLNGSNNETVETLDEKEPKFPNPNNFDLGLSKNEVKRQEVSSTSTTSTTAASTTVSATVEAETPSLTDLEASFGGETQAVTEPPVPETTTRRTGFYYLVDWNTFLDIDDTKGKRVNLRFQPTIGDPKRFLSVGVP